MDPGSIFYGDPFSIYSIWTPIEYGPGSIFYGGSI
ncbi:hypothetical protein NP493_859g01049 [Ridgeia piscesae]|uniref:Uncharacterized protein n=1 Tax=Ridgeia piscesae TaxID=27915 RepID=A0AAD9KN00_RIDPI|nr:hypothetical protein NP493_859g01049 [Ridgeia piscesae]